MIPLHPEATGDPRTVRWVVPAGTLRFVGIPQAVPAPLAALLGDGTLDRVSVEPAAVLTISGRDWRVAGPAVRTALAQALAVPIGWQPPADKGSVLASAVEAAGREPRTRSAGSAQLLASALAGTIVR